MLSPRRVAVPLAALVIGAALVPPPPAYGEAVDLDVFAGTGTAGATGDGGPASAAALDRPGGVAVAADGSVYLSDAGNRRVRKVAPDGTISTVAGSGRAGTPGTEVTDGTSGTEVDLALPQSLAVGRDDTLYIADTGLARVFRLAPDGRLSVVAGTGVPGPVGDGGPAARASFGQLGGLAVAPDGTVYVGDVRNHRVRAVTPDGTIDTVAGNGNSQLVAAGGEATTIPVPSPGSLAVDGSGDLWIADGLVLHRLAGGKLGTVTLPDQPDGARWELSEAGNWPPPEPPMNNVAAVSAAGDQVYALDQSARTLLRLGDGAALGTVATLDAAGSPVVGPVAVGASGVGYLVDNAGHRVYSFRLSAPNPETPDGDSSVPWWPFAAGAVLVVIVVVGWLVRRRSR
ncbi:hypothetical protein O7626_02600 [Micromonospora sp. WMMD1102]|uniref:NHL domain-containing protein n=1 Tax=Micromonospora sp. WMMD1102 TaxID=3016105 RepID=UPI0024158FC2|nr:hypothetical protein [Micromonospora sp. WMMD1102]MDG4784832.1 hypothetical protein [Micromonospora sp. WMMD1102]